jgi:hypothetical protein
MQRKYFSVAPDVRPLWKNCAASVNAAPVFQSKDLDLEVLFAQMERDHGLRILALMQLPVDHPEASVE